MRVLIIRTSALGDVVHCLPVLSALRRHFPAARIGWVVEKWLAPLLASHPDVDDLVVAELRQWRKHPLGSGTRRGIAGLLKAMDQFSPDVVLDLMGNHKAGVLAALSFCDRRIGLRRAFRREPSSAIWINEGVDPAGPHAVDRALSVVSALGLPPEPADFGGQKILTSVGTDSVKLPLDLEPPFLMIHPGASWANKRYPPHLWGEVARRIRDESGFPIVAATGPGEEELGRLVAASSAGAARWLHAPELDILTTLVGRAQLVLGGDTGPVHLAHAVGTPVLCIMGPTDPATNGPYDAAQMALWKPLPCSFCHQRFDNVQACLLELPPQTVAERAFELLRQSKTA